MFPVSFIWCHYDQIWTIKKSAIDLCDISLYPQEKYIFNDVSYIENVRVYFKKIP